MTIVGRVNPRRTAAALALGIALSAPAAPALAEDIAPPDGTTPVVGMAYDGSDGLWLAGPEADSGVITHSTDGREVTFSADPESVQALAWSGDRLWIADIGDESAQRGFVVVFRLGDVAEGRNTYHAFDFQYDDGPRDAKAMMISGRGRIYVATTGDDPGIYRADMEPSREQMNTLTRVADAPDGVTDGSFLTDGATLALRTAAGIEYIDALTWEPLVTDTLAGAPEGESISVGGNDEIYVGGNPTIRLASVPSSDVTTTVNPEAVESPSPSPSPSPSAASPTAVASETVEVVTETVTHNRTGTAIALALAGAVAITAGAVTFFLKK